MRNVRINESICNTRLAGLGTSPRGGGLRTGFAINDLFGGAFCVDFACNAIDIHRCAGQALETPALNDERLAADKISRSGANFVDFGVDTNTPTLRSVKSAVPGGLLNVNFTVLRKTNVRVNTLGRLVLSDDYRDGGLLPVW